MVVHLVGISSSAHDGIGSRLQIMFEPTCSTQYGIGSRLHTPTLSLHIEGSRVISLTLVCMYMLWRFWEVCCLRFPYPFWLTGQRWQRLLVTICTKSFVTILAQEHHVLWTPWLSNCIMYNTNAKTIGRNLHFVLGLHAGWLMFIFRSVNPYIGDAIWVQPLTAKSSFAGASVSNTSLISAIARINLWFLSPRWHDEKHKLVEHTNPASDP